MFAASKKWTSQDDDQLRTLAAAECSLIRIAGKLGRTMAAVKRRAYVLDVKIRSIRGKQQATPNGVSSRPSLSEPASMSGNSLTEELSHEIKRIEKRIDEIHRLIRNELNDAPQLFDAAESEKELRALEVRLQELKQTQARDT